MGHGAIHLAAIKYVVQRTWSSEYGICAFLTYYIVEVIDVLVMFELLKHGFRMESIGLWCNLAFCHHGIEMSDSKKRKLSITSR